MVIPFVCVNSARCRSAEPAVTQLLAPSGLDSPSSIADNAHRTTTNIVFGEEHELETLQQRDRQPELMDQPDLDPTSHRRALGGLSKANLFSRTAHFVWRELLNRGLLASQSRPLRILDVATGGGDVVIRLAKLAARHGAAVKAHGCDINPTAIEHAHQAATQLGLSSANFFQLDALQDRMPEGYDVIMCTLFLHHLTEADAQGLLRRMAQSAQRCVLIDDLRRSRFGYALAWAGPRLLTRSAIVHTDGPLSVRAAFSLGEVRRIAERAGLSGATLTPHWPQRFMLSWMNNDAEAV